jgi:hypothetical protein
MYAVRVAKDYESFDAIYHTRDEAIDAYLVQLLHDGTVSLLAGEENPILEMWKKYENGVIVAWYPHTV